jgi:hypothetical protein
MCQLLIKGRYHIESRVVRVGFFLLHSDNHIPFLWCMWIAFHMVIWWLFWDWSFNLGGNLIKPLTKKRGVGCINSCKFLQLFLARKQVRFCACCFYVSFDFHRFSHFEITICDLSVPWFRVVLGSCDSFMHSMLFWCTLLITKMFLLMNFTILIL